MLQNKDIFFLIFWGIFFSVLQIKTSGLIPTDNKVFVECCNGFVLISFVDLRYGNNARWIIKNKCSC